MKIDFILNGEDVTVETNANFRLIDILRNKFNLTGSKENCLSGRCGVCAVMLNGKVVPSCMIPVFKVKGKEIITIEGFSKTVEYGDIIKGFNNAGVKTCGYCDAAKILLAETLLNSGLQPERSEITSAINGVICRCTNREVYIEGVLAAFDVRQRRMYGRIA